jgi:hypothetical protein
VLTSAARAADIWNVYERFRDRFAIDGATGCSGQELLAAIDPLPDGFADLLIRWAGASCDDGLYRLLAPEEMPRRSIAAGEVFPGFAGRALCFAVDWLGRLYAIDVGRPAGNGEPLLVLLDPWSAEPVEIDAVFVEFHDDELVDYGDEILATGLRQAWLDGGGALPAAGQCVGYRVPLFAGGADEVANLEIVDLAAAWERVAHERNGSPAQLAVTD